MRVEQQESTAAGAEQLAPDRAVAPRALVPVVDRRRGDAVGQRALQHPALVEHLAEAVEVAGAQLLPQRVGIVAHPPQHREGLAVLLGIAALRAQHVGGGAREASVEHEQTARQLASELARARDRLGEHALVRVELA